MNLSIWFIFKNNLRISWILIWEIVEYAKHWGSVILFHIHYHKFWTCLVCKLNPCWLDCQGWFSWQRRKFSFHRHILASSACFLWLNPLNCKANHPPSSCAKVHNILLYLLAPHVFLMLYIIMYRDKFAPVLRSHAS